MATPLAPALIRFASKPAGPVTNADIPHKTICYVDENNKLSAPTALKQVLATMDTTANSLILVDPSKNPPICRIVPKPELYKKARSAAESSKKTGGHKQDKTVTLRWKVAPNDLTRKLDSAKKFLAKGYRVSITFEGPFEGSKAAKETAVRQVATQLLDMAASEDLKIKEWHQPKFTFRATSIYYQPAKN